ncbi:MAG TPA: hypothetical protein VGR98_09910 [Streptosporangiaceae bacterium]|nr:hypothetical protein [Streptosporangiaceae bacterium]
MGLTIIGAVLLITGLLMVLVGEALRLKSGHGGTGIAGTGELVAFCGLGIGVALLAVLAVGRPHRGPADRARSGRVRSDRARSDRARSDRARGDGSGRGRRRSAVGAGGRPGRRRDTAEEWLGPLRTAGAGVIPRQVPPRWPEAAESRPAADGYADDGWHPDLDQEWSPGPAYVWSPGEEDGWDKGADGDWDHGGDQDWNLRRDQDWNLGRDQDWNLRRNQDWNLRRNQDWNLGRDQDWDRGEPGEMTAWPQPPHFAADPEAEYPGAAGTDIPVGDRTREGDDTSPIPVVRDAGHGGAQPRATEPPEPFSVWEPAPKPQPVPAPEPFSVWEPAPKPGQQRDRDGGSDDAYQPAHAEPSAAHTQEKIEQIKDLYLTAEAIGEDALSRHFDELRQRQRSLISEFFENAGLGTKDPPRQLGDDPAQDGASLPG